MAETTRKRPSTKGVAAKTLGLGDIIWLEKGRAVGICSVPEEVGGSIAFQVVNPAGEMEFVTFEPGALFERAEESDMIPKPGEPEAPAEPEPDLPPAAEAPVVDPPEATVPPVSEQSPQSTESEQTSTPQSESTPAAASPASPSTSTPPSTPAPSSSSTPPPDESSDESSTPPEPSTAVEVADESRALTPVDRAALAALNNPTIPGRDEFLSLAMQASVYARSEIVPKSLQGKPADVLVVLMTGRDLGIPVTAALRKVYVIDGQPSVAPLLKKARIETMGLGTIKPGPRTDTSCSAIPYGPDGKQLGEPTVYSWDEAQLAELVLPDCQPKNHSEKCRKSGPEMAGQWPNKVRVRCKQNWRTYPFRMLQQRADGYCADDWFPQAGMGLYSPDELGALTDENGLPIDPATVTVADNEGRPIPGFEPSPPGRTSAPQAPAEELAPEDVRESLKARANDLPGPHRLTVKTMLHEREIAGFPYDLGASKVKIVESILDLAESNARKEGWEPTAAKSQPVVEGDDEVADGELVDADGNPLSDVETSVAENVRAEAEAREAAEDSTRPFTD